MNAKQSACAHPYAHKLSASKMLCRDCGAVFEPAARIRAEDEAELIMPPEIFILTPALWEANRPWHLISFKMARLFGWYRTLLHGVEYLVMPVFEGPAEKGGKYVSYSARKMWPDAPGLKYDVPKGRARRMWLSKTSAALLGSYGDIGKLITLGPRYVAEGVADAAWLSQLPKPKRFTIVMDGDVKGVEAAFRIVQEFKRQGVASVQVVMLPPGKDPTDVPVPKLKKLIAQQTVTR